MKEQTASPRDPEANWFGDRPVGPGAKTGLVQDVFSGVASRYDLMNDLMSGGVHRLWKARFIERVRPRPGETILDLAGGTGDIALGLAAREPKARVVICDLTPGMIRVGRDRAIDRGLIDALSFVAGNAEALPFADRSADAITIAFGLRNVARIDTALTEIRRVLKPGGRFLCLEFSRVRPPGLARLYDSYSRRAIPLMGRFVARDEDSYRYLVESIRRFPDQPSLARRMEAAGLGRVAWRNLTGGIAAIHTGWRL